MRYRIGTYQHLEGIKALGQISQLPCDCSRSNPLQHGARCEVQNGQGMGAGSHSGIQDHDVIIGKDEGFPETCSKQFSGQCHLGADRLHRRVVHAAVFPELWIVRAQELLVEVPPRVCRLAQLRRVLSLDGAFEQFDGHPQLLSNSWGLQQLQPLGEQAVLPLKRIHSYCGPQTLRSLESCQQERVGHRLGVGVGKLSVIFFWEEQPGPLTYQRPKGTGLSSQRSPHIIP